MDVGTFEDLIDRLGDDLSRWPDAERCAGRLLLASLPEARTLFEQAKALRAALEARVIRAPAGLAGQIIAAVRTLRSSPEGAEADAAAPAANLPRRLLLASSYETQNWEAQPRQARTRKPPIDRDTKSR
ncbi:hypothetical protein BRAS3843_1640019 [Bradyrhizobium sp. STM 3843]|nr:hypothetical protein BRAS3843_1640019 [Bradyrhizobium sp. STM 3843]